MRKPKGLPSELRLLRGLPIDDRANAIIGIFQFAVSEFAAMVLEHAKPRPKPRARSRSKSRAKR
jgi:hypothetical protein